MLKFFGDEIEQDRIANQLRPAAKEKKMYTKGKYLDSATVTTYLNSKP